MDKKDVAKILHDYGWIISEIARQRRMLSSVNTQMTARYGLDATMPRRTGTNDPVSNEVVHRERKNKWIAKLEAKALYVQERLAAIDDEREIAILECIMDGMSMVAIQRHMGISKSHLFRLRDSIIEKMITADRIA